MHALRALMRALRLLAPAGLLLAQVFLSAPAHAAARMPLGSNTDGLTDWNTEVPFLDPFKLSRAWTSASTSGAQDSRALDLDEHGWVRSLQPGQIARTGMACRAHDNVFTAKSGVWDSPIITFM